MEDQRSKSFWTACDAVSGLAATEREWRRHLGDGWDVFRAYFRPASEYAESIPISDHALAAQWRVVRHSPGDFVAVPANDEGGEPIPLTLQDVIVYEFDLRKLTEHVCAALALTFHLEHVPELYGGYQIGAFEPLAGCTFPAFLVIGGGSQQLARTIDYLARSAEKGSILTVPTTQWLTTRIVAEAQEANLMLMPLGQAVAWHEGRWYATPFAVQQLDRLRKPLAQDMGTLRRFPTPPGATWRDVKLHFLDGHTIEISIGSVRATYTVADLGLEDRRKKPPVPNEQWELLHSFSAKAHLPTGCGRTADRQRQLLGSKLKDIMGIESPPLIKSVDGKRWETVFEIL